MPKIRHHVAISRKAVVRLLVILPPSFLDRDEEDLSIAQNTLSMGPRVSVVWMKPGMVQWDEIVAEVV